MYVFRHDDIANNTELIAKSNSFKCLLEEIARSGQAQIGSELVTTEGDEVKVS